MLHCCQFGSFLWTGIFSCHPRWSIPWPAVMFFPVMSVCVIYQEIVWNNLEGSEYPQDGTYWNGYFRFCVSHGNRQALSWGRESLANFNSTHIAVVSGYNYPSPEVLVTTGYMVIEYWLNWLNASTSIGQHSYDIVYNQLHAGLDGTCLTGV